MLGVTRAQQDAVNEAAERQAEARANVASRSKLREVVADIGILPDPDEQPVTDDVITDDVLAYHHAKFSNPEVRAHESRIRYEERIRADERVRIDKELHPEKYEEDAEEAEYEFLVEQSQSDTLPTTGFPAYDDEPSEEDELAEAQAEWDDEIERHEAAEKTWAELQDEANQEERYRAEQEELRAQAEAQDDNQQADLAQAELRAQFEGESFADEAGEAGDE